MKTMTRLVALLATLAVGSHAVAAVKPGSTTTVFNRRFLEKVKPMMPYPQLVSAIGVPGMKVAANRYHWNGGRKTQLDVTVAADKVVDATATTPKQQTVSLGQKRRRGLSGGD